MRIRSKAASIVWKLVLIAFCTVGLLEGSGILAGNYLPAFPYMFTNISNMFAWVYFVCTIIWLVRGKNDGTRPFAPVAKYTATISLLVTMLIAHFMLFDNMFQDGQIVWHLVWLHYVVPLMTLLDWVLFDEKGKMPVWGPFSWMSLVVAYLAFTMVYVGVFGGFMGGGRTADISRYPYTFLDPAINGVGGVVAFCAAMFVAFLALGFLLYGIDRLLAKRAKSKGNSKDGIRETHSDA